MEYYEANPSASGQTIDQLRLEYRLLPKVGRNFDGKSSRAIDGWCCCSEVDAKL
ncbi:hypothetical protein Q7V75_31900 [Microcoleus sp. F10B5]